MVDAMTRPTHLHHRSRKFWTQVEIARNNHARIQPQRHSAFWPIVILVLAIAILIGAGGCKSGHTGGSAGTAASGTEFAIIGALAVQLEPRVSEPDKPLVQAIETHANKGDRASKQAAKEFDTAIDSLADEIGAHKTDVEKRDGEIKDLKGMLGYRIETFIRKCLRILKWLALGWALLGILGFVLPFIGPLAPIGLILRMVWRGMNSFVIGMIPHGTNAANLIGRVTSIGVGDGSIARTPPI
jgi:hypothetical protein